MNTLLVTINMMAARESDTLLEKLSIISAIILLTYSVTSFANLPEMELDLDVFGVVWKFSFDLKTYISILVPGFAGVGAYWLVKTHPAHRDDLYPLQHCILPTLTAWVIGLPLTRMSSESTRWMIFALGATLLIVVLTAEYIVVDIKSEQHLLASGLLKALSLAMIFFVVFVTRMNSLRLYLFLPSIALAIFFILLRVLYLQTGGKWMVNWSLIITLILGELALGLHYLPVHPISFGLILLSPLYALVDFASTYPRKIGRGFGWVGPAMMAVFLLLAVVV